MSAASVHRASVVAYEEAGRLVLEWLRTRRALVGEHRAERDMLEAGFAIPVGPTDVDKAGWAASDALSAFAGRGGAQALAVIRMLDHHFAADYSEIHGCYPTLTFTAEFGRVLAAGGKDAFERSVVSDPATESASAGGAR